MNFHKATVDCHDGTYFNSMAYPSWKVLFEFATWWLDDQTVLKPMVTTGVWSGIYMDSQSHRGRSTSEEVLQSRSLKDEVMSQVTYWWSSPVGHRSPSQNHWYMVMNCIGIGLGELTSIQWWGQVTYEIAIWRKKAPPIPATTEGNIWVPPMVLTANTLGEWNVAIESPAKMKIYSWENELWIVDFSWVFNGIDELYSYICCLLGFNHHE